MSGNNFTPVSGFSGGALIGVSAGTLLLYGGDILGMSGLVASSTLNQKKALTDPSVSWKLLFLSTFMATSNALGESFTKDTRLGQESSIAIVSSAGYLIGGALVGFGTKLGNGCTTGHGISGMARLSKRSIIAALSFFVSGVTTATLVAPDSIISKSTAILRTDKAPVFFNRWTGIGASVPVILSSSYSLYNLWKVVKNARRKDEEAQKEFVEERENEDAGEVEVETRSDKVNREERIMINDSVGKIAPSVFSATLFAGGLAVSGMVLPSKILGFLNFHLIKQGKWDPTLLTVMGGGSILSFISYQFVEGYGLFSHNMQMERPRRSSGFSIPNSKVVDIHLVGGALCFGMGWGISGLCPGPALYLAATGTKDVIQFWWPSFIAGSYLAQKVKEMYQ